LRTWKPTTAGVLTIIAGTFMLIFGFALAHLVAPRLTHSYTISRLPVRIVSVVLGLVAVVGGIFAIRRQAWGLALAGAICSLFPPHPYGSLIWTPLLGMLAIAWVTQSKGEFNAAR
jgi:uncharacterized membrane protein